MHQKVAIAHSVANPKIPIPAEQSHALNELPWNAACTVIRQIKKLHLGVSLSGLL